jgi:hypothetical protein
MSEEFDIGAWCKSVIEGSAGMNDYEEHELVVWHDSERVAAAKWVVRCLANPRCEGSAEVLEAILRRRETVKV